MLTMVALGVTDAQAQVQHGHRASAHVGHADEFAGQPGQLEQAGPAQDFLHLEDVDAKKLTPAQAEQQQGEAVVAGQAGALVDAVEQVLGHVQHIGRGMGVLSAGAIRAAWHGAARRGGVP